MFKCLTLFFHNNWNKFHNIWFMCTLFYSIEWDLHAFNPLPLFRSISVSPSPQNLLRLLFITLNSIPCEGNMIWVALWFFFPLWDSKFRKREFFIDNLCLFLVNCWLKLFIYFYSIFTLGFNISYFICNTKYILSFLSYIHLYVHIYINTYIHLYIHVYT
jgi:hypothetical protein